MIGDNHVINKGTRSFTWDLGRHIYYDPSISLLIMGYELIMVTIGVHLLTNLTLSKSARHSILLTDTPQCQESRWVASSLALYRSVDIPWESQRLRWVWDLPLLGFTANIGWSEYLTDTLVRTNDSRVLWL